jgi:opacity protein-like surface antigen
MGAHLGYNVQLAGAAPAVVLGGEFSLSRLGAHGSKANCFGLPAVTCNVEDDWLLLAMGRLGLAPSPFVMGYGMLGWAVAGLTSEVGDSAGVIVPGGISPSFSRASAVHDGVVWGAGLEFQFQLQPLLPKKCCTSVTLALEWLSVHLDQ